MALIFSKNEFKLPEFDMEVKVNEDLEIIHAQRIANNQFCKDYARGSCRKEEECKFRHHHGERSVVCKHWLRGLCKKNDRCEFLHELDMTKMPQCHFFTTYKACENADCDFLHVDAETRIKDCPWYARGFCKHGPNCRNRHQVEEACPDYFAGFCLNGPSCTLKHPKFALPTTGTNKFPMVIVCHLCKEQGHTSSVCPKRDDKSFQQTRGFRSLQDVTCYKCHEKGHYADRCTNARVAGARDRPHGGVGFKRDEGHSDE